MALLPLGKKKIALIPSKSGDYVLPAIEIPWFNTKNQKIEVAKIAETKISAVTTPGAEPVAKAPVNNKQASTKVEPMQIFQAQQQNNMWIWIAGILGFGWLTTLIYFLTLRPVNRPSKQMKKKNLAAKRESDLKIYVDNLKKACSNNDPNAAKNNLILWGRQKFNVSSLGAIAQLSDARLRDEILRLNQVLYGKDNPQWNGKKLFQAFSENKAREKKPNSQNTELEPLYRI